MPRMPRLPGRPTGPRRRRFRFAASKVFITGAASGIGRAMAERAGREGAVLHLTDVQDAALQQVVEAIRATGGDIAFAEACDVSDYDAVKAMTDRLTGQCGSMDVVANVAGIATWGTVSSLEHEQWRRLVDVNLMGPIHVIETLVPPMVDAGRGGHLINVSSAAGIIGMPWHAAYSASKFGLRGVSEVLRFDLARQGISVHLVCPGAVDTGLTRTVHIAGVDKESRSFTRAQAGFRRGAVSPEKAADAIWSGVVQDRYWVYTSGDIRAIHSLQRHLPRAYGLAMRGMSAGANRLLPEVEQARRPELRGTDR